MTVHEIPHPDVLFAVGEGAASLDEKADMIGLWRERSPELCRTIDRMLLEKCERLTVGMERAGVNLQRLREIHEQLTAPAWHVACFVEAQTTPHGNRAMVMYGGSEYMVAIAPEVPVDSLAAGDEVLLSQERNCILAKSPAGVRRHGETAAFNRMTRDGRLVIESEGKELVVRPAATLDAAKLARGDQLLYDKNDGMAFEKIERSREKGLFCEDITPESQGFEAIGGLEKQKRDLRYTVDIHLNHPEVADKYQVPHVGGVLLTGRPGVGKTMLIRGLANYLARTSRSGKARYVYIRPGEFKIMWYGESERRIRDTFRDIREAASEDPGTPVVLHLAEVDSIGSVRGHTLSAVDDRVQQALMEEMDGITGRRGNILVIADTNRADALDPALVRPGRLGDLIIEVPRPDQSTSRHIFGKHLPENIPFVDTRQEIIESCVSAIFSPNGESELATLTFRDGKRHVVRFRDLVSGAAIANICRKSIKDAAVREIETGRGGVRLQDFLAAVQEEFETIARVLSPVNVRHHLENIPQDMDVVAVTPVERRVRRPHRYLDLSAA